MKFFIFLTFITIACADQRFNFGHQNDLNLINRNQVGLGYGPILYNQNGYTMNNLDLNMRNHLYRNQINDDQILNNGYNFIISGSHLDKHGLKNNLVLGGNAYTFSDNLAYDMKMPSLNMYNDDLLKNSYKVQVMHKEPLLAGLRLNSGYQIGAEKLAGNNVYLPMPAIQAIPPPRNPVIVENIVQQKLVSANLPVARAPIIRRVFRAPVQAPIAQPQMAQAHLAQPQMAQAHLAQAQIARAQLARAQLAQAQMAQAQMAQAQMAQAQMAQAHLAQARFSHRPVHKTQVAQSHFVHSPIVKTPIIKTPIVEEPIVQAPMTEDPMIETPVIQPVVKYSNDRVLMKPFMNMQHSNYLQPHHAYERIEPQVNSYSTKINHVVPMKNKKNLMN